MTINITCQNSTTLAEPEEKYNVMKNYAIQTSFRFSFYKSQIRINKDAKNQTFPFLVQDFLNLGFTLKMEQVNEVINFQPDYLHSYY